MHGVLSTEQVLLNVVIPLWLVRETDAPSWLLAWLFATNTMLVVALQVAASRGVDTVPAAVRASWRVAFLLVAACVIVLFTDNTTGVVTIALIWIGYVVLTGAELFGAAADWVFAAELSDPARRAEYQGAIRVGNTLGSVWAPAVYTYLATQWSATGWLLIGAIVLLAASGLSTSARASQRYLDSHTQLDRNPQTST